MNKVNTKSAPEAIGTYSQAMVVGQTVYLSGQIGLNPLNMQMLDGIEEQINQVFKNLRAVCQAAGGELSHIAKLNIYLTDMVHFPIVNKVMAEYFTEPYPARAAVGVKELPKAALVEADGVMILPLVSSDS